MKPAPKINNLLVTEDDKVLIRFYQQALEEICDKLIVVGDSGEALRLLTSGEFDFLITDLKLENKDGLDIINCAVKYNSHIQIMVASGYVTDADYHDKMQKIAQIKGYLQKPFTIEVLLQKIDSIISRGDNHPSG